MRYLLFLPLLLACSSPRSTAPRKYGSFLGPGFVQRPDTLAALSALAAAGNMVQYDGAKWELSGNAQMPWAAGFTYQTPIPSAINAAATLGIGTLRCAPFRVPNSVTLTKIGAEVTVVGDAGSKVRLGIYKNSANLPSTLVLDAGTIAGDNATAQSITISQALTPDWYWACGVVQNVTTTQPTVRTAVPLTPAPGMTTGSFSSSSIQTPIAVQTSVTGALPSTFTGAVSSTNAFRMWVSL